MAVENIKLQNRKVFTATLTEFKLVKLFILTVILVPYRGVELQPRGVELSENQTARANQQQQQRKTSYSCRSENRL